MPSLPDHPRRSSLSVAIVLAATLALALAAPAAAVQFGEPDGTDHPHVGLLVFDITVEIDDEPVDVPAWRCSGTLLSPTVMLTAGHCTFGTSGGRVWFDPEVDPAATGYPFAGGTGIEFAEIHTHPDYVDEAFFLFDIGVVILSEPVVLSTYGELADIGLLDQLATRRGLQDRSFTVVGYGLQSVVPRLQADLVRHRATVQLIDVRGTFGIPRGTAASFTNNPGRGNGRGGTCFGDSGGPIFHGQTNVIAAVTSFGLNFNCAGVGGGYRVDTTGDQAFINQFLD